MNTLRCAIVAVALLCANAALAADAPDCTLKQVASLPITTTSTGKIAVPVKIAGRDVLMAVDTSTHVSGINANFVDELGLSTSPIPQAQAPTLPQYPTIIPGQSALLYYDEVFTRGENVPILRKVTLPELQIGIFDIKDYPVSVLPRWTDPDGIVGVLGSGFLQRFDVELDFANAKMNLYLQDHCAGKVVYWANEYATVPVTINSLTGETMAPMTLDGAKLIASLSTNPGHSTMSLVIADKALGNLMYSPDLKPIQHPDHYDRKWFSYPFKTLSFGGLGLQNPPIDLVNSDGCDQDKLGGGVPVFAYDARLLCKTDVSIRLDELKHFHLYFAFGESKLYLTPADAHR